MRSDEHKQEQEESVTTTTANTPLLVASPGLSTVWNSEDLEKVKDQNKTALGKIWVVPLFPVG